jgi:hypothetical protein
MLGRRLICKYVENKQTQRRPNTRTASPSRMWRRGAPLNFTDVSEVAFPRSEESVCWHDSTLNMDTAHTSRMSFKSYQYIRRHTPEDSTGLVTAGKTANPAYRKAYRSTDYRLPVSEWECAFRHARPNVRSHRTRPVGVAGDADSRHLFAYFQQTERRR